MSFFMSGTQRLAPAHPKGVRRVTEGSYRYPRPPELTPIPPLAVDPSQVVSSVSRGRHDDASPGGVRFGRDKTRVWHKGPATPRACSPPLPASDLIGHTSFGPGLHRWAGAHCETDAGVGEPGVGLCEEGTCHMTAYHSMAPGVWVGLWGDL